MLETIEMHVTNACTHSCPYCYMNSSMSNDKIEHADLSALFKIVDELRVYNVKYISLVGGDPVQHPDIESIIEYIHNSGIKVSVMSNTMYLKNADKMSTMIDNIDVTIHGRNRKEHDDFCRCDGAYDMLMTNLRFYASKGININVAVNVIPQTYDKVYDIIEGVITQCGIHIGELLVQRILPYGRAGDGKKWAVTPDQVNTFFSQAVDASQDFGIDICVEDPYPLCCLEQKYHHLMHGCPEGRTRMAIDLHGDAIRCGAEPVSSGYSVIKDSIKYIWEQSGMFDSFRKMDYIPVECKECSLVNLCRCGCPISCMKCMNDGWYIKTVH